MAETTGDASETNKASQKPNPETAGAKGTMPGDAGKAKAEPSGSTGQNPSTGGSGGSAGRSVTAENAAKQIDPSAPGETGTTPGTNA